MSLPTLTSERLIPVRLRNLLAPWEGWFNNGGSPLFNGEWRTLTIPAVNISEDKKSYKLSLAAPGLKKEDFKLDLDGDLLTISSEKEEQKEEKDEKYSCQEYSYTSFSRTFTMPAEVQKDKIEAKYDNGILLVTLPKSETAPKARGKAISVK